MTSSNSSGTDRSVTPVLPRAWLMVAFLTSLYLINFLDKSIAGLAAVPIMTDLRITPAKFGLLNSAFYVLFIPLQLLGGVMADRWRSKWILLAMAVVWSIAAMPVVVSAGFGALLASRVILGAGEGPTSPVAVHSLYKWFANERRAVPHAFLTTGGPLAIVAGAPILIWFITHAGWRMSFFGLGVLSLVWSIAWLLFGREGPYDSASKGATSPGAGEQLEGYRQVTFTRTFVGCFLVGFASYFALTLMFTWLPHYLESALHLKPAKAGIVISLAWVVSGLGPFPVAMVSQRLMVRGVPARLARGVLTACILVVSGVFLAGAAYLPLNGTVRATLVIAGLSLAVVPSPVLFTVLGQMSPIHLRGGVLGVFGACIVSAGLFAPTIMGLAIQAGATQQAGYLTGFFWFGVFALACGGLGLVLIDPDRDGRVVAARLREDSARGASPSQLMTNPEVG